MLIWLGLKQLVFNYLVWFGNIKIAGTRKKEWVSQIVKPVIWKISDCLVWFGYEILWINLDLFSPSADLVWLSPAPTCQRLSSEFTELPKYIES